MKNHVKFLLGIIILLFVTAACSTATKEAESNGEVTISESGIVVNFPVLVWPGGSR